MLDKINQNPEILFLFSVLFYWFSTSYLLNPVAIGLMTLGIIMALKRFKVIAVIVGAIYLILNTYMVLALMSEFREFPEISNQAILMLTVGGSYILINIYISIRLILNNVPKEGKIGQMT